MPLLRLPRSLAGPLLAVGAGGLACTTEPPLLPPAIDITAAAFAVDSISQRTSTCVLRMTIPGTPGVRADTVPVSLERQVSPPTSVGVIRDTMIPAVAINILSLSPDTLRLVLGSPFGGDTLRAVPDPGGGLVDYHGTWSCAADWPLASDSLLAAHGYQPVPLPMGTWLFMVRRPIG